MNDPTPMTPPDDRSPASVDGEAPTDARRRAALGKLGALAVYAPPVLLTLATSSRADPGSLDEPPPPPQ